MKKKNKETIKLFNTPIKRFLWAFFAINLIGIGINAILYYFQKPNSIETLLNATPFFITIAIIAYIVFNLLLYFLFKIHFLITSIKE